jgi:hypothetical protein
MGRPDRFDRTTGGGGSDPGGLSPEGAVFCESHDPDAGKLQMAYLACITARWSWLLFVIFIQPSNTGSFVSWVDLWFLTGRPRSWRSRTCPPFSAGSCVFAKRDAAGKRLAAAQARVSHFLRSANVSDTGGESEEYHDCLEQHAGAAHLSRPISDNMDL